MSRVLLSEKLIIAGFSVEEQNIVANRIAFRDPTREYVAYMSFRSNEAELPFAIGLTNLRFNKDILFFSERNRDNQLSMEQADAAVEIIGKLMTGDLAKKLVVRQ